MIPAELIPIAKRFADTAPEYWVKAVMVFRGESTAARVCGMLADGLRPLWMHSCWTASDANNGPTLYTAAMFHLPPERDPFYFDFVWEAMAQRCGCQFCGWLINDSEEETRKFERNYPHHLKVTG